MSEQELNPEVEAEPLIEEAPEAVIEPEAPDPLADALARIAELEADREHLLRAAAEMQNITRRLKTQAENDRKFAVESLAASLLPVLDGLERTIAAQAKGASTESLVDGVRATDKQFRRVLESVGIKRIVALGAPFDPARHEALATVDDAELDEDTVTDEIEAGYELNDRVIRAAKVRVSKKP